MDLRQLDYIVTIAEEKSISKAAGRFFISQSALSQQVSKLEKQLDVVLFERSKEGLELTPAGQIYVDNARRILTIRDETFQKLKPFSGEASRKILVGAAPGRSPALFTRVFGPFSEQYPNQNLSILEGNSGELEKMIPQGKLNLAFTMVSSLELLQDLPFRFTPLKREKMVLITPANHPMASRFSFSEEGVFPQVDLRDFNSDHFALPSRRTKLRKYINAICSDFNVNLRVSYEVLNTTNIFASLGKGSLCAIVSDGFLPEDTGNIRVFSLDPGYYMDYGIISPKEHILTDAEEYFITLCREYNRHK